MKINSLPPFSALSLLEGRFWRAPAVQPRNQAPAVWRVLRSPTLHCKRVEAGLAFTFIIIASPDALTLHCSRFCCFLD
ncbi:hypothetical protein AB0C18_29265 [Nonomuraea muscovyensis]|uniref:hypothetical protein n=1 Tax=Nonomuraea muscovyensis TaxID=1124761 RepID=UPI0033F24BF3